MSLEGNLDELWVESGVGLSHSLESLRQVAASEFARLGRNVEFERANRKLEVVGRYLSSPPKQ